MTSPDGRRDDWRRANLGRLLSNAVRRFEARVLELMAAAGHTPLRLSQIGLTKHLDVNGTRIGDLARRAGMTKQAMSELVRQCEQAGLVAREDDPHDRRAQRILFTAAGLRWLGGFRHAVEQAEREMRDEVGAAQVDALAAALGSYGAAFDPLA